MKHSPICARVERASGSEPVASKEPRVCARVLCVRRAGCVGTDVAVATGTRCYVLAAATLP